jgi:long-chain fatty acid transport protein
MAGMLRNGLKATTAIAAIIGGMNSALAGGFINQSQSTVFNGMAYAGWGAAGGDPSSMFINPATMTQFPAFTTSTNLFGIFPYSKITGFGNTAAPPNNSISSGDIGQDAFSTASYYIMPLSRSVVVGLSVNSPFGFTTSPNTPWGGQNVSETTSLRTYTFTPSIAFKYSEALSFGFGIQAQYAKARIVSNAAPPPVAPGALVGLKGDGSGFGITAGVTYRPWAGTEIGLGYRSRINQELEGRFIGFPAPLGGSPIQGFLKLPDRVNLSVRQAINSQWDVLGTVEWQGWSRIGTSQLKGPLVGLGPLRALPFEYKDGWFFALGSEYKYSPKLTLRGGVAYEIAPVSDRVRSTRLTDNDRLWTSIGMSYKWSERLTFNASYSHVFVKNAPINVVPGNPNFNPLAPATFQGRAKSHVDIVSLGLTTSWGGTATPVVAKY